MDVKAFWERFIHTGEPAAYLQYRGLVQDKEEQYGASNAQGAGHSGK